MNERVTYDAFSRFYDQVMGDPSERIDILKNLIGKYAPNAKSILEFACGTGSILKAFEGRYNLTGLDFSSGMLEQAKQKLPSADLRQGDMTSFNIGKRFDVVLCVFDSINHLTTFPQWEALFRNTEQHLNPDGIFIFDMNTHHKLENMAAIPTPFKEPFDGKGMELKVTKDNKDVYHWNIKVREPGEQSTILYEEDISEVAFDTSQVFDGAQKYMDIVEYFDDHHSEVTDKTNRIYFVCKKRATK